MPYQRSTFVTPAFPGYVSGHSTFSRAAAEVLTGFTGSPYFPGGLFEVRRPVGSLELEEGPKHRVVLQAATYYDAADQAGVSRIYGGIHVFSDDLAGRELGSVCGKQALSLARRYFDGSAG
jgi:PAP2 superfamily